MRKKRPHIDPPTGPGPACPYCPSRVSTVLTALPRGAGLHRVRRCLGCEQKFVTTEAYRQADDGSENLEPIFG